MMERRNALTLPFNVDKDNLMESPFKISMTSLSPECGKFKRQVSWTEFSCKRRHSDPQHKNGSVMSDHRHASKITVEMSRKQPCLILTDVLKTERGKTYMERIKQSCAVENGGQVSSPRKESGRCREKPALCTDRRSSQREARNAKNKSVSPKCSPKTPSITPSHRLRLKRRLQNAGDDVDKEEKDIEEVIIGKDCGEDYKFATEVVDCGLSVSWDPAEDPESCDEFSAATIKDKCTDSEREVQHSVKRKIKDAGSHCNGTSSPKRHRESVLRLTGEDGRDGGPAPTLVCQEDGEEEDVDLESLDRSIVQFTVGADVPAEILLPINIANNLEAGDFLSSRRQSVLSSQDNTTSEPIVLSSDEEESCDVPQRCSPLAHSLVTVEDAVIQRQSQQDALTKEQETSDLQDMQVLHVVVEDLPRVAVSLVPSVDYSCMGVAFFSLFCGGYQGKSNGDIMVTEDKIIIPLKDTSEKVALMLNIERKELRRYSVWEQQELEAQELYFEDEEEPMPPSALFLCVSDTAAAAIHRDLHKLYVKHGAPPHTGKVSPFVLLTLRDPLEGMEGALLRSLLDIDCLNCLSDEKSIFHNDAVCDLDDIHAPVLSLDDSIKLIRRTGLDSHLLTLLGLESAEPTTFNTDEPPPLTETDKNATPLIRLEVNPQKETILEVEAPTAEGDAGTQLKPEEEQKEQKLEPPTEKKKKDGPTPVYTLCHRRTKGSYSVSLCKPDSSWIKYKHKGLAHRLIQFPPPPLKGGITVTMEDLQCLDSGQFLNDVIIDFYLKYLLHKASPAVTERSHIFSSFFYKQLTRRDNASEGSTSDSCQRQRRHQRVKTWTRHVDIFKKDFLFVPVNQEAHWYLVVICFPGLAEPKTEAWSGPNSQTGKNQSEADKLPDQETTAQGPKSPNDDAETQPATSASNHSEQADAPSEKTQEETTKDAAPGPVSCTEQTYQEKTVCKRPCILIMDSLKRSLHERVFKLLRDYLESEWEVRRGSSREFGTDQMQSSHCQVPLQDNSSDCGLYLLQYVESFLKDPVVHFDLPLHLQRWFPRQQVRRKRDEIRDLVLNLYRHQNLESNR